MADRSILIVEDEPIIAELLQTVLGSAGYDVTVAHDVSTGVGYLGDRHFDLCISDFLLPDRTGLDLAREITRRRPGLRMVLVTAYLEPELESAVRAESAIVDVVRKPMDVFALRQQVDRWTSEDPPIEEREAGG